MQKGQQISNLEGQKNDISLVYLSRINVRQINRGGLHNLFGKNHKTNDFVKREPFQFTRLEKHLKTHDEVY